LLTNYLLISVRLFLLLPVQMSRFSDNNNDIEYVSAGLFYTFI
jgi:hypothetical protein